MALPNEFEYEELALNEPTIAIFQPELMELLHVASFVLLEVANDTFCEELARNNSRSCLE